MNSLKKVLTKDDVKRYQKSKNYQIGHQSNIKQNSISDRNNWTDINQLIECRTTYKKSLQAAVEQKLKSLIRKSFQEGFLAIPIEIFVESLKSIIEQYYPQHEFDRSRNNFNQEQRRIIDLLQILQRIHDDQENNTFSKNQKFNFILIQLRSSIQHIKKYLEGEVTRRKNKDLNEYDKIIGMLKPTSKRRQQKKVQKRENVQKLNKKLINSLSSGNLHIKVTTEEIYLQKVTQNLSQKNIQDQKNQKVFLSFASQKNLKSPKNEGQIKLQTFLKDSNYKVVKTKIQYDYNAILQASKSNIQARNKTYQHQNNSKNSVNGSSSKNNFEVTNINRAKKDQAFVFYRPKTNKNPNK